MTKSQANGAGQPAARKGRRQRQQQRQRQQPPPQKQEQPTTSRLHKPPRKDQDPPQDSPSRSKKSADAGRLAELFARFGFETLTEIQSRASPVILQRRDCLAVAPTGSGKTECSVIPIFSMLSSAEAKPGSAGKRGIRVLYVTPLRALNRDVFRRITGYAEQCGLGVGVRHGDTPQSRRKKMAENPPDVMITTPETLVVLLSQPKMLAALSHLEWVVIDEVHELLASKRGAQLSLSLERLELNARRPLTRIGLSATIGNVTEAAKFVSGTKRDCKVVRDRSMRRYDVDVLYVEGTISDAARAIYGQIAGSGLDSPVLLFANTRGEAEFLASVIREESQVPVELHHGSLSKAAREEAEQVLRGGSGLRIVVCTSSLELGIDIGDVELVAHYGSPRQASKFVQRIGRSRHAHGASARGIIIANSADDELEARAIMERVREGSVERQRVHECALDVLAHHMVGLSIQAGDNGIRVDAALDVVRQAYPYRDMTLEGFVGVLEQLESSRLVQIDRDAMTFQNSGGGGCAKYHYENLSTIPDILRFKVFDSVGRKSVGTLDQRFVGDHGQQGSIFVLRGSQWRILNVDEKSFVVNVEPMRGGVGGGGGDNNGGKTIPYWEGESIPIDRDTALRVGRLRGMENDNTDDNDNDNDTAAGSQEVLEGPASVAGKPADGEMLQSPYPTSPPTPSAPQGSAGSDDYADTTSPDTTSPDTTAPDTTHTSSDMIISAESRRSQGTVVVLHCCFGSRINATLSALLSSMLSGITGSKVESRSDGYRIALSSASARLSLPLLLRVIREQYDLADVVGASLAGTHNVNWRVWCAAKKFGVIGRGAIYEGRQARFLYHQYAGTPVVAEALRELFHDKYDLDGCSDVLNRVRDGSIRMFWHEVDEFSKVAAPILDHTTRYYSSPASLDRGIAKQVKERLAKTKHRIVCMRCGRWERAIETRDVVGRLACPHCRGRQITVTFHSDVDLSDIVRRRVAGAKITADEKKKFDRAWKVASLVESFGPVAVTVMSGYGIGADTAARILRSMISDDEDNLIKQIYEAERQYVTTRGFWD